jgi:hypothetical protein
LRITSFLFGLSPGRGVSLIAGPWLEMVSAPLDGVYGRLSIFIVFLVTFTLYGIEGIADEIGISLNILCWSTDDPFGTDENGKSQPRIIMIFILWLVDVQMDPLFEGLKGELEFVLGHIKPQVALVAGV